MSDEKIPELEDDSEDNPSSPTAEEDDAGKGFGTGGNIASITNDAFDNGDDADSQGSGSGDDAGGGFGTGGDVKAPKD